MKELRQVHVWYILASLTDISNKTLALLHDIRHTICCYYINFTVCSEQLQAVCGNHVSLYQLTVEQGTALAKAVKRNEVVS